MRGLSAAFSAFQHGRSDNFAWVSLEEGPQFAQRLSQRLRDL